MSSEHLRKYLAYYQKTLREEPENIEARLRLAALFREMGRPSHAVEEYVTASKLLAAQGLALEAIAACKAVLEIDPTHTEVQFFLARLFAQVPDAAGGQGARVARPVAAPARPIVETPVPAANPAQVRLQHVSPEEAAQLASQGHVITLARPKTLPGLPQPPVSGPGRSIMPTPWLDAVRAKPEPEPEEFLLDEDSLIEEVDEAPGGELGGEPTSPVQDEATLIEDRPPRQRAVTRAIDSYPAQLMLDAGSQEDLRSTLAMEPEDVLERLRQLDALDRSDEQLRRTAAFIREPTVSWQPSDRSMHRHFDPALQAAAPDRVEEITSPKHTRPEVERFTVGVFDMDSVDLDGVQVDPLRISSIIGDSHEEAERLVTQQRLPRITPPAQPLHTVSIRREDLPEIPLLSGLGQQGFIDLLNSAVLRQAVDAEPLLTGADRPRSLFIILRGEVSVSKLVAGQAVEIARMGAGDFFGEFALLTGRDIPSAIVTARGQTTLLELTETMLQHIGTQSPEIWDILWDVYHMRMLNNLMSTHAIFGKLSAEERDQIADLFELIEHPAGQTIVDPQMPCPAVFLILFGEVRLRPQREGQAARTLREGEFFGLVASLSDEPGRVWVEAVRDTTLLALPAREFRALTRSHAAVATEIRRILRERAPGQDLFMAGITPYADVGFS
jgi:CRP-like cAMP-binding protein